MRSKSSLSGRNFSLNDGANGSASFTVAPSGGFPTSSSGNVRAGSYALTATNVTETHVNFSNTITLTGQVTYTKKPVTVSISASDKVYDRFVSANSSASISGIVSGDTVTLNTSSATFADRDAGNGKTVTMAGIGINGTDAANYDLQNFIATTTANITPKPLTVSFSAANKVFDGTSAVEVQGSSSDVISGDFVEFEYGEARFIDDTIGAEKLVRISGIYLSGPDANNYNLLNTTAFASAVVSAPADIAGSVYYIDWATPTFVGGDASCNNCIDWKRLYKMLKIDDKIKSIINYVSISNQDEENNKSASIDEENNKSAAIEEKNDEIDEENNISNLILTEKEKFEMLL